MSEVVTLCRGSTDYGPLYSRLRFAFSSREVLNRSFLKLGGVEGGGGVSWEEAGRLRFGDVSSLLFVICSCYIMSYSMFYVLCLMFYAHDINLPFSLSSLPFPSLFRATSKDSGIDLSSLRRCYQLLFSHIEAERAITQVNNLNLKHIYSNFETNSCTNRG